jgi:hypothetical protein
MMFLRARQLHRHERRNAATEGIRQPVVLPIDDGSMPWSNIQVLQDQLRERTARC